MKLSLVRLAMLASAGFLSACGPSAESSDGGTGPVEGGAPQNDAGTDGPGQWEKGYEPHDVVPGTTTTETSPATAVESGKAVKVTLSDGTAVELPAQNATAGTGALTTLTLSRESTDVDLGSIGSIGEVTTGSMRVLRFESFDPVARGLVAANVAPIITIPAKEIGSIDHDTVGVARIADLMDNGQVTKSVVMLPASWDAQGNLRVRDYLFPDSLATDLELKDTGAITTEARTPAPSGYVPRPRRIAYVAGTFQSGANWARSPKLVRMVPNADVAEKRTPIDRVDAAARELAQKRCFHTAVVLVHGHNEEEGLGSAPASVAEPWLASYKRDVWTHLYETVAERGTELACARFYELVYPSYRSIFTPQNGRERLDEAFARLLGAELKPQLDKEVPVQVVVVAHSMGGLVARAGVQLLEKRLQANLRDVITWGTPHTGSPLVTLRYALGAVPGYQARSGLVAIGLDNVDHTLYAFRRAIEGLQVDSPGTRDLRWAPSATTTPHDLALDAFLELSPDQIGRDQEFDLVNGPLLYNENLKRLNGEDIYRVGDKYLAFYGQTPKRAKLTWTFGKWFRPTIDTGGDIAIGATANDWLVKDPNTTYDGAPQGASDGAVPVSSAAGAGVVALSRLRGSANLDHEEFFGAPSAPGTFTKRDVALEVANTTLSRRAWSSCPTLGYSFMEELWMSPPRWELTGTFTWPDVPDSSRLIKATDSVSFAILASNTTLKLNELTLTPGASVDIRGWVTPKDLPDDIVDQTLRLTIPLIDGTFAIEDRKPTTGCVTPQTLVSLPGGGTRAIAQMKRGDAVLAYEPGLAGRPTEAIVERVLRHVGKYTIDRLVAEDGSELDVTGNHPVLTLEGGYQPVSIVGPGDHVFVRAATGGFEPRQVVAVVRDVARERVVYNLKTTRGQYVAEGIVVHNKCLASGSWIDTPSGPRAIETLLPGDRVLTMVAGARVTTTVTHVFAKTSVLDALPGRELTPHVLVTDNHPVALDGARFRRAGETTLPSVAITGPVYDLATTAGTYLADGVLVAGGE